MACHSCFNTVLVLLAASQSFASVPQQRIPLIDSFPQTPSPWAPTNWSSVALAQTAFIFDATRTGQYLPLLWWDDAHHNVNQTTFGTPSYVGGATGAGAPHELIAGGALVLSGLLAGAPMSNLSGPGFQGVDFERMLLNFFDTGAQMWADVRSPNGSFWYQAWNSMLPLMVASTSQSPTLLPAVRAAAATWLRIQAALDGNFNVSGIDFDPASGAPIPVPGNSKQYPLPVVSAGVAWLLYATRAALGEGSDPAAPALLAGAGAALDYLLALPYDSYWEVLMPYGALACARINAEQGASRPTGALLANIFQPGLPSHFPFRWGWGTLSGAWGAGVDVAGLTGASSDRGGYCFAFDTFATLAALLPIARYEAQWATALGRYGSNAANAARLFFPFASAPEAQSNWAWVAAHPGAEALSYEGLRRWGFNSTDGNITGPYATGDGESQGGLPTNLAVYGGAYVGLMAGLVLPTLGAGAGVAAFNLTSTDFWARPSLPTTLVYNGGGAGALVQLALPPGGGARDVYDAVAQAVVARGAAPPSVGVWVAADGAGVFVAIPAGTPLVRDEARNWLLAGGVVVDWQLTPKGIAKQ